MKTLQRMLDEVLAEPTTAVAFWIICIVLAVSAAYAFANAVFAASGRP